MGVKFDAIEELCKSNNRRNYWVEQSENGQKKFVQLMYCYLFQDFLQFNIIPNLTKDQDYEIRVLKNYELDSLSTIQNEQIFDEIELNIVNMDSSHRIDLYLTVILKKVQILIDNYQIDLNYDLASLKNREYDTNNPVCNFLWIVSLNYQKLENLKAHILSLKIPENPKSKKQTLSHSSDQNPFILLFSEDLLEYNQKFVQILKKTTPPLINNSKKWLFPKGAAKIYVELLVECGIFKADISHKTIYAGFTFEFGMKPSFMKKHELRDENEIKFQLKDLITGVIEEIEHLKVIK